MLKRVCLEALPAREIHQVVDTKDLVQLLYAALRYVDPNALAQSRALNRNIPSEAAFHAELYPVIRDILHKATNGTKKIYPQIKAVGTHARANILVDNGDRFAYEMTVNQLFEKQINVAMAQADRYRIQFGVQRMLLVNFVPVGRKFDRVYRVERFPTIEIGHVRFSRSCADFNILYLPEESSTTSQRSKYFGKLQSHQLRKVKCLNVTCRAKSSCHE